MTAPTCILWSIREDGVASRAILDRSDSDKVRLAWYLDDVLQAVEEFSNTQDAMRRAEELRLLLTIRRRSDRRATRAAPMVAFRQDD